MICECRNCQPKKPKCGPGTVRNGIYECACIVPLEKAKENLVHVCGSCPRCGPLICPKPLTPAPRCECYDKREQYCGCNCHKPPEPKADEVETWIEQIVDEVGEIIRVARHMGGVIFSDKRDFAIKLNDLVRLARQVKP